MAKVFSEGEKEEPKKFITLQKNVTLRKHPFLVKIW